MDRSPFPSPKMRLFLAGYGVLWFLLTPLALAYLFWRGRRDPLYRQHLGERFGFHKHRPRSHVWIHAVSLGELRSAEPLIRAFLKQGEQVVTTHFTPAGRREANRLFAREIEQGQLSVCYVPFDTKRALGRFVRAFNPSFGLVMEVEYWPQMVAKCRQMQVPLFLCNGQYPSKSYERDKGRLRSELVTGFAGVMVKSERQAGLFASLGVENIAITGEMRFEQAIPETQLQAATVVRPVLAGGRPVITIASAILGEDDIYIGVISALLERAKTSQKPAPFFVYVPRAPERFGEISDMLTQAGIRHARRSDVLAQDLSSIGAAPDIDLLLGDSMGEMYFYLSLCDQAIVGGSFSTKGAHNVIEPLAVLKPVLVGPHIWTIEYPATEAIAAGVLRQVQTADELQSALQEVLSGQEQVPDQTIEQFLQAHSGAVEKTLKALPVLLENSGYNQI